MSAPPIGMVTTTPKISATTKNNTIKPALAGAPSTINAPKTNARTAKPIFTQFCAGNRWALFIKPCNLANATHEPVNDTEPISAPNTANTTVTVSCVSCSRPALANSIAAIAAAAPPPMPLYTATICGMSVICTFLPEIHAAVAPMAKASSIKPMLFKSGTKNVPTIATSIPTPAQTMPLRAVVGEPMPLSPNINIIAPMSHAPCTYRGRCNIIYPLLFS